MAPTASNSHSAALAKPKAGISKTKPTKMTRARVQLTHPAFSPASFALSTADRSFTGGNMYADKDKPLTLCIKCRIATPLSDEESYACFRLAIQSPNDDPATADILSALDDWTTRTVQDAGKMPKTCKLFPLIRANGWSNFKVAATSVREMATDDGRDWSQIKQGERGTLTLNVRGIWRSEELGGYGLMIKLGHWAPDETDEEGPPAITKASISEEDYSINITGADVDAAVAALHAPGQFA
jgi:hypothetical protein